MNSQWKSYQQVQVIFWKYKMRLLPTPIAKAEDVGGVRVLRYAYGPD